jgi:hypothetical protein
MDSQSVHRGEDAARSTLEVFGVLGLAMIAYIAVGVLLEATTGIDVPFVAW